MHIYIYLIAKKYVRASGYRSEARIMAMAMDRRG